MRHLRPSRLWLCLLVIGTAAQALPAVSPALKQKLVREIGKRLAKRAYAHGVDFSRWPAYVEKHRTAIDEAEGPGELGEALSGALDEFGTSHLWIWTPEEVRLRSQGRQGGMGVKTMVVDEGLLVTMVLPDSGAESAGLERGDVILTVDGEPATPASTAGRSGESRRLGWRRAGVVREAEVTLTGARRAAAPSLRWLDGGIAWLTVPTFSFGVYDEARIDALFEEAASAAALVVDLRSNSGGRGSNLEHLLAHLLPAGTALFGEVYRENLDAFRRRNNRQPESLAELLRANGQVVRSRSDVTSRPYSGPLAVVIDGRSGSSADVFPAVVQDTGRGIVIGTPSAGKVLVGDDHQLSGGFVLFHPLGEPVRAGGRRMEGNPIRPDVELSALQTVDDALLESMLAERLLGVSRLALDSEGTEMESDGR